MDKIEASGRDVTDVETGFAGTAGNDGQAGYVFETVEEVLKHINQSVRI
jgi:hypothetical protein